MQRRLGETIAGLIGPVITRALHRRIVIPVTNGISRTNSTVVKETQIHLN